MSLQLWNLSALTAYSTILIGALGSCSTDGGPPANLPNVPANLLHNGQCSQANADEDTTPEGISRLINVLANDSFAAGAPRVVAAVASPTAYGNTAVIERNQIRYTPKVANDQFPLAPYTDTFTYTMADGCGGTSTATVTVRVTAPGATANVFVTNNSHDEITVSVGDTDIDTLQPHAITILPQTVDSGTQDVSIAATGGDTSTLSFTFVSEKRYMIIYSDTRLREPTIAVQER